MNQTSVLSFLMALLFVLSCAGMASAALTPNAEGVYEIGTAEGLAWFRDSINSGGIPSNSNARLTADITLTGDWTPIGQHVVSGDISPYGITGDYSYSGTFDGGGKTITGLKITSDGVVNYIAADRRLYLVAGLFGVTGADGVVKNLTVQDVDADFSGTSKHIDFGVIAGTNTGLVDNVKTLGGSVLVAGCTGGIAGVNAAEVANCTVSDMGSLNGSGGVAGGVVGYNKQGTITNSAVSGIDSIEGHYAGGVAGYNASGTVTNGAAGGIKRIEGYDAGGVVGFNEYGTITNSAASEIDRIEGSCRAGGVVGYSDEGTVTNSKASGIESIAGDEDAGGVAGENKGTVADCTAGGIGKIVAKRDAAGGIVGDNYGPVRNCVASDIGLLDGGRNVGKITGYNGNNAAVTNCVLRAGRTRTVLSGDQQRTR